MRSAIARLVLAEDDIELGLLLEVDQLSIDGAAPRVTVAAAALADAPASAMRA